jgi:hypothetical protein
MATTALGTAGGAYLGGPVGATLGASAGKAAGDTLANEAVKGWGFKKGSAEAKAHMAKIRAMRKKK